MEVYKFGGASVRDAAGVQNVVAILKEYADTQKVVVVSAMGKTTNALEKVTNLYYTQNSEWKNELNAVLHKHYEIVNELFETDTETVRNALQTLVDKAVSFLENMPAGNYNFLYDQLVSIGEYLSTTIISHYARSQGLNNTLLDAKKVLFTDHAYTEAKVDFEKTERAITSTVLPLIANGFVITQGFVGCSEDGFTTTLGREGSDYTAAIFAYSLNAETMTVWKDVAGVLNADPKLFPDAVLVPELTFREAIEMTYYGASVLHPKTIKPLQNKDIPMLVRSFIDYKNAGTVIHSKANAEVLPPILILKTNQTLLSFSAKDFSFIAEEHLSHLFAVFSANRLRANLMQNAAISYSIVVDYKKEKIDNVVAALSTDFSITRNEDLTLLTIRHYNQAIIEKLTANKEILLRQVSRDTIQVLIRS